MKSIILVFLLLFPSLCFADEVTGVIDNCVVSETSVVIQISDSFYQSDNSLLNDSIIHAFRYNQDILVSYHTQDDDNIIDSIGVSQSGEYFSKIVSLFIGSVSAAAFAFGLGVKLS